MRYKNIYKTKKIKRFLLKYFRRKQIQPEKYFIARMS